MTNLQWRKSSRSGEEGDHCVELAGALEGVAIRDSKNPDGGIVQIARGAFAEVVGHIKAAGPA